ncbi:MAG TPA: phospholipase D-like domain-containing protein [Chryseolinea sp.]
MTDIAPMTEVKAHFTDIHREILSILDGASSSIKVCMAWLTDRALMNKLTEKLNQGLYVEICLLDHSNNRVTNGEVFVDPLDDLRNYRADFDTFQDCNGILNIIPARLAFVHNKFAVIDNIITITGSYNWTWAASRSRENIVVIRDEQVAADFSEQLREIVSKNHHDIIQSRFSQCGNPNCVGRKLNIKIIDYRHTSKWAENEVYRLSFCTKDFSHTRRVSADTQLDILGNLIEAELDRNDQVRFVDPGHRDNLLKRRMASKIAWEFDSRLDFFVTQGSHDVLGVYKITRDDERYDEIKAIWEHDLIAPFSLQDFETELVEIVDALSKPRRLP